MAFMSFGPWTEPAKQCCSPRCTRHSRTATLQLPVHTGQAWCRRHHGGWKILGSSQHSPLQSQQAVFICNVRRQPRCPDKCAAAQQRCWYYRRDEKMRSSADYRINVCRSSSSFSLPAWQKLASTTAWLVFYVGMWIEWSSSRGRLFWGICMCVACCQTGPGGVSHLWVAVSFFTGRNLARVRRSSTVYLL
jgi:hypothetical protein